MKELEDGDVVTLDVESGTVYAGKSTSNKKRIDGLKKLYKQRHGGFFPWRCFGYS